MQMHWRQLENKWRRELLADARGLVLETWMGPGANFRFYPGGVKVIGTDTGSRVLQAARLEAAKYGRDAVFIASEFENLKFNDHSFDTIVCTFSLFYHHNPGQLLTQFHKWCKPEGQVLILEYGLSRYGIFRWLQQKWDPLQYRLSGIHRDKDFLAIIRESPLQLQKVKIKYGGMVYLVWASSTQVSR